VHLQGDDVQLEVIGGGAAVGLCGSGILAAVRELLENGLLRPTGAFVKVPPEGVTRLCESEGKRAFLLQQTPPLWITQQDVRQVQLAKRAILSGFTALLRRAELETAALDGVLVAGQFGAHLPARSLAGVGIVPPEAEGRITYVGNSAKTGAQMALLSQQARRDMEQLAQNMKYLELAETADYQQLLMQCMRFPAPQRS